MPFRGNFRVDELTVDRRALAIERLRAGDRVVVRNAAICAARQGGLTATVASRSSDVSRVSADSAIGDLGRAVVVDAMTDASAEFAADARGRTIELEVVVDYDTGSVLIARSTTGAATWADGRPLKPVTHVTYC